ncbi:MAG TPA: L-2-hydroxyglutarate oxidase [Candidatus Limnocylindrales bacterium]|nr:L-2-hydroxyglutarate oxidase [Candidatus Limnocylindrales bacterium]
MSTATGPETLSARPPADRADVAVVGGGIVGLATAYQLLHRRPGLRLVVVEQEAELGAHQSGHNSGVLHAGIYYAPGSLKARLCRAGKAEMEAFCEGHGIPFQRVGKLVVALDETELARLEALRERATANGVPGLEVVGPERIAEIEPHAAGVRALWSPTTGIVDFRAVVRAIAGDVAAAGGVVETGRQVTAVSVGDTEVALETSRGPLVATNVVTAAGLWADRVARLSGDRVRESIVPFRGDYYSLTPDARSLVRGLIYPLADPRFPFLGVHFTRRVDGEVWAGPNAVLAFARRGYRRRDVDLRDLAETLTNRGFLRLAGRFWRTGAAEFWRDISERAFHAALVRYLPELRRDQLVWGPSGVRAQALDPDGSLVDDFRLGGSRRILHVRNAPSPAATASLAIGAELASRAIDQFGLG